MADKNKESSESKAPTHRAFHVREAKNGGKGFWTPIGAAWAHEDGEGFNPQIELRPRDGKIVLRTVKADEGESA